jgi:hypothetical protein
MPNKINTAELLVTKVIDDIANACLPEADKLKALDDIIKMLKQPVYADHVDFKFEDIQDGANCLAVLFTWWKSDLGYHFWGVLYAKIYA